MLEALARYAESMVWVDETATYMDMTRTRGRAPRGQRVWYSRRRKYRRHTLIVAMTLEGVLAQRLVRGGMTLEDWRAFCREDLAPKLSKGQWIQLDNLNIHYDQQAYGSLYEAGGILLFQPAYSPESNPVEEVFSLLKRHLRRFRAANLPELRCAIAQGLEAITPAHLHAFWRHAQRNVLSW